MANKLLVILFGITAIYYSVLKDTDYSHWVKPLPIICCLAILFTNAAMDRATGKFIAFGLFLSVFGDVALDLGATTIGIAIFTLVMLIYGWALYFLNQSLSLKRLLATAVCFGGVYILMFPYLEGRKISGLIYQVVLSWMVWRGAVMIKLPIDNLSSLAWWTWLIFAGTIGIALNGVLYGIDLYLHPIPRDVVIHCYYLGQLSLVLGTINLDILKSE